MDPDWLEAATALRREGRPFVLATVVAREAPQAARMGAKAIVLPGGELLGWIGAEVFITDPVLKDWVDNRAAFLHWAAPAAGAVVVSIVGVVLSRRAKASKPVDLVA